MPVRRWTWVALVLLCLVSVAADALPVQWAFRVYFTDKQGSRDINNPAAFLSQRALDRRNRQNIAVDTTDLPVTPKYIDSVLKLTNGVFHCTSRWMNTVVVLLNDSTQILNLQGKSFVKNVVMVGYYDTGLHQRPAGNKFSSENQVTPVSGQMRTNGTAATYGYSFGQVSMVNGDYLHDHGLNGDGVLIAMLDAGYANANTHTGLDSLRSSGRLVEVYDLLMHDSLTAFTSSAHGFMALSVMAGNMPGTYVGTAPRAMYALYRTEEEKGDDRIVEMDTYMAGAERADSIGADVISSSLGYYDFQNPAFSYTNAELDGKTTYAARAAMMAVHKGIVFVSSAGNDAARGLVSPGDCDSVLSVGMVDVNEVPGSQSSYGPNAAGHIKPDVAVQGAPAFVFSDGGSGVGVAVGTSFAAPQIAGWVACLLQGAKPGTTPFQIRTAIDKSADHYNNPGAQIGYGIPDFKTAAYLLGEVDTTKTPETTDFIAVWPNAFTTDLRIKINAAENQTIEFAMVDMAGRTVWRASQPVTKGSQWWHVAVPGDMPAGMYLFRAVSSKQQQTVKLVRI